MTYLYNLALQSLILDDFSTHFQQYPNKYIYIKQYWVYRILRSYLVESNWLFGRIRRLEPWAVTVTTVAWWMAVGVIGHGGLRSPHWSGPFATCSPLWSTWSRRTYTFFKKRNNTLTRVKYCTCLLMNFIIIGILSIIIMQFF